jgi:carbonic anhydrase
MSKILDELLNRNHSLLPASIPIYGYIYDVTNGSLIEVPAATKVGTAAERAQAARG